MYKNKIIFSTLLLIAAVLTKYLLVGILGLTDSVWITLLTIAAIMFVGAGFVLKGSANIIEETTEVLSEKTKVASGVLQSIGTGFPDVAFGVTAALASLNLLQSNYAGAINFAVIAASTAFGSNIYNIGHATWAVWRQNKSNKLNKPLNMFPPFKRFGQVIPFDQHKVKPAFKEFDIANDIVLALTVLTMVVAVAMVLFGKVSNPLNPSEDMYQMIRPIGLIIFIAAGFIIYFFRKVQKPPSNRKQVKTETDYFRTKNNFVILLCLFISGIAILIAAESMVVAIERFSVITSIPVVVTGVLSGVISCLGEMMVVHNFSVHPEGRIGDAIVGVAMDNIVTTMAASIVAMMGGIFLGGNALILIFVIILSANTALLWQISRLKNYYLDKSK